MAVHDPESLTYVPIENYGAIGDGRSVALVAHDGSIDLWGAPTIDSPPLFDRLLDAGKGTSFTVRPTGDFTATHAYRKGSNVLVTTFTTHTGTVRLTDSLNSGAAGRLPWTELARRLECTRGTVELEMTITFSSVSHEFTPAGDNVYADGELTVGLVQNVTSAPLTQSLVFTLNSGDRRVVSLVVSADGPVTLPSPDAIDGRIDSSNDAWRHWSSMIDDGGEFRDHMVRSLLALKLLLYSPSGAIAASASFGLPERIGGDKNYDYRYAWVRDTAYTIKAMIRGGLTEEVHAALAWLMNAVDTNGLEVFYTLDGSKSDGSKELPYAGYRGSKPVVAGNKASGQLQLGLYGDIIETVHLYATEGNRLNARMVRVVAELADECARRWRKKDAGIWELPVERHYTISKIGCWLAFDRAVALYDQGHLSGIQRKKRDAWAREREAVIEYIEKRCWNKTREAYAWYVGGEGIDASLMLATRFGYPNKERLSATLRAIENELKDGPYVYRYSGARDEEGAFTACAYWLVEGYAFLGRADTAKKYLDDVIASSTNALGLSSEMTDPTSGMMLGNMPQGLSHLTMIHAIDAVLIRNNT